MLIVMSVRYYFSYLKPVDGRLLVKAANRYAIHAIKDQLGDNSSGTQIYAITS
jgi:hypothetical protein